MHDACADQDREQSAHRALEEQGIYLPCEKVKSVCAAIDIRVLVGQWQAEADDVHQQNAEQRHPADNIQ